MYLAGVVMLAGGIVGYWLLKGELLTVAAVLAGVLALAAVIGWISKRQGGPQAGPGASPPTVGA